MKTLPLILLALMAALFGLTLGRPEAWAGWVNAFAEAGMVGALADWFAVVALFRHPMGIPIPHTAIIPNRKDRIGENLARFIAEHFLEPEIVRARLTSVNLAGNAASWLKSPAGERRVREFLSRMLLGLLDALDEDEVRQFLSRVSARQVRGLDVGRTAGRTLELLVADGRHQEMLTQALRFSLLLLHDNRDLIRGRVQRESPWWLPGFIDDRIVVEMLERIETLLFEMALSPDHPMRGDFDDWVSRWAAELQSPASRRQWSEQLLSGISNNDALQEWLFGMWQDLADGLRSDLKNPDSDFHDDVARVLSAFADELESDGEMQLWLNGWLQEAMVNLLQEHRDDIAGVISDTVHSWDATETSRRVEAAIGRDLQFIRINGTLVGGFVGVAIHAFTLYVVPGS